MSNDPKDNKKNLNLFETEDDPLLQDLSSALMSEKPEELLNFKVISKGLGLHDLKKSPPFTPAKGHEISFNISEIPGSNIPSTSKTKTTEGFLPYSLRRLASSIIDGIIIFTISLFLYNFSLLILLGDFSKKSLDLVASVFTVFFNSQSIVYFATVFFIVWIAYFIVYQSVIGSTIGKILSGLKLMRKDGSMPRINHILTFRTQVVSDL